MSKKQHKELKTNKQSVKPIEENKYLVYGMLGVFLIMVFFASSYKIFWEDDFFWHLAVGRYVAENYSVPNQDVFSHTTLGSEWIPFEWGWDVMTYSLQSIGGINAVLIFRSLAYCFIFFVYFMLLRKFKINSFISIFMLFLLLAASLDRLSARPHLITYIFFTILLYILVNYKYLDREKYSRRLYFLPLIFLIWANFHMGVIAGGLLLFLFTISETIIYFKPRSFSTNEIKPLTQGEFKKLWIISIACALVLFINPNGLHTFTYVYGVTKMKSLEGIAEWKSPFSSQVDTGITLTLYKVFLFSLIIVFIYALKKKDLSCAIIAAGFALHGVRSVRFTVDYELIVVFYLALSVNYFVANALKKNVSAANFLNGNVLKGTVIAVFIFLTTQIYSNKIYDKINYYRVFGWGVDENFVPVQLVNFMKENNISGKPYNSYSSGGYLIWNLPNEKNYIDSRCINDEIFEEYSSVLAMKPGFDKKLEQRGVDYVVYFDPEMIYKPNDMKKMVVSYFSRKPEWKLVFWDDKSMLFVKNLPKFADVINKCEYKVLNPYTALFYKPEFENNIRTNPEAAKNELSRKLQTDPNGYWFRSLNEMASKVK
jgi:hypothetical protein